MAIYHLSIKNISRASGKSSVASAAYRSGQALTDERQGITFRYRKSEVAYSAIFLCENAPAEYAEREALWNAVEKAEKRSDARLAREWEVALPNELSLEQSEELVRDFAESLAAEGMCVDVNVHWKEGNHHAHVMGTTRPIKANGEWGPKEKKAHKLDADGQRIPQIDPKTGKQKVRERKGKGKELLWQMETVEANDWNKAEKVDEWRGRWESLVNGALERAGKAERVSAGSNEARGIERIPTIHEGHAARRIEETGEVADRCETNRRIKQTNRQIEESDRELERQIEESDRELAEAESQAKELARQVEEEIYGRLETVRADGRNDRGIGEEERGAETGAGRAGTGESRGRGLEGQVRDDREGAPQRAISQDIGDIAIQYEGIRAEVEGETDKARGARAEVERTGAAVDEKARGIGRKIGDIGEGIGRKIGDIGEGIGRKIGDIGERIGRKIEEEFDRIRRDLEEKFEILLTKSIRPAQDKPQTEPNEPSQQLRGEDAETTAQKPQTGAQKESADKYATEERKPLESPNTRPQGHMWDGGHPTEREERNLGWRPAYDTAMEAVRAQGEWMRAQGILPADLELDGYAWEEFATMGDCIDYKQGLDALKNAYLTQEDVITSHGLLNQAYKDLGDCGPWAALTKTIHPRARVLAQPLGPDGYGGHGGQGGR